MTPVLTAHFPQTANDRFKEAFGARMWLALILATFLHVLPFRFFPVMEVEDWTGPAAGVAEVVQLPPTDLPDKPAEIQKPGVPVAAPDLDVAATMPTVDWAEVPTLPPPPVVDEGAGVGNDVSFVPMTQRPLLLNPAAVERVLQRVYPAMLRNSGVGGTVELLVHIDTQGRVLESRVGTGSGLATLDQAALRVAEAMEFRAAMNRDVAVAVWIQIPVTFQVR